MECNHEFVQDSEGTTIKGEHIRVFKCIHCGLLDHLVEFPTTTTTGG